MTSPWLTAFMVATVPFLLTSGGKAEARWLQSHHFRHHPYLYSYRYQNPLDSQFRIAWARHRDRLERYQHQQMQSFNHFFEFGRGCSLCDAELPAAKQLPQQHAILGSLTHADESDTSLELEFETARADMETLTLEVDTTKNTLTVAGKAKDKASTPTLPSSCGCSDYQQSPFSESTDFMQSFELPRDIYDLDSIAAVVSPDKRLCVSIPKKSPPAESASSTARAIAITLPDQENSRDFLSEKEEEASVSKAVAVTNDEEDIDLDAEENASANTIARSAEAPAESEATYPTIVSDEVTDEAQLKEVLIQLATQGKLKDSKLITRLLQSLQQ